MVLMLPRSCMGHRGGSDVQSWGIVGVLMSNPNREARESTFILLVSTTCTLIKPKRPKQNIYLRTLVTMQSFPTMCTVHPVPNFRNCHKAIIAALLYILYISLTLLMLFEHSPGLGEESLCRTFMHYCTMHSSLHAVWALRWLHNAILPHNKINQNRQIYVHKRSHRNI